MFCYRVYTLFPEHSGRMTALCAGAMKFGCEVGSCAATPFALPLSVFRAVTVSKGGTGVNLTTISVWFAC